MTGQQSGLRVAFRISAAFIQSDWLGKCLEALIVLGVIKTLWIYALPLRRMAYSTYQERGGEKLKGRKEKKVGGGFALGGGESTPPQFRERRPLGRAYESTYM